MTSCFIKLSKPVISSLDGDFWFQTQIKRDAAQAKSGGINSPARLYHFGNSIVGDIKNYPIYFLCSRPRLLIVPTRTTDGAEHEFIRDPSSPIPIMHFSLAYEYPKYHGGKKPIENWCTIKMGQAFAALLAKATGTNSALVQCSVPKFHPYPNAILFKFQDGTEKAFYISPDLWPFMRFDLGGPAHENIHGPIIQSIEESLFNFQVHYIGQSTQVAKRLDRHEKFGKLTSHLQQNSLHEESMIFVFSIEDHNIPLDNDPSLHIDLVEACLIDSFQAHLNVEFKDLKAGKLPNEIQLRNRIKEAGVTSLEISLPTPHDYQRVKLENLNPPLWFATSMEVGEYFSKDGANRNFWNHTAKPIDLSWA